MPRTAAPRFEDITETTGVPLTPEGAEMIYTRYSVAAEYARGKRVLEVGCAAGQGFGLLARSAATLVGGDYSWPLLESARSHFGHRVPVLRLSADALPFRPGSFDLVLCFEASYYFPNADGAFDEFARVLAPGGLVMFVNANPERPDFIRSPHSFRYHTADDFRSEWKRRGFSVDVSGAFPVEPANHSAAANAKARALSIARRGLEAAGLVPKTLRGRARLKRLVFGKLPTLPPELPDGFAPVRPRVGLATGAQREFKVIYVLGSRRAT